MNAGSLRPVALALLCAAFTAVYPAPRTAAAATAPTFQLPMRGNVGVIGFINGVGDHTGADAWAADLQSDDTAVYPVKSGNVVFADRSCLTKVPGAVCYGNVVAISHDGGYYSIYTHLADGDPAFTSLQAKLAQKQSKPIPVAVTDRIGYMGETGCSGCGPHLHFAIRFSSKPLTPIHAVYGDLPGVIPVNIWQYPSTGGTTWIPGLPWPQATTDDYNNYGWSIELTADISNPTVGQPVALHAKVDVSRVRLPAGSSSITSVAPFQIELLDKTTGQVVQTCTTGLMCSQQVAQSTESTHMYAARAVYHEAFSQSTMVSMATSRDLPVTWQPRSWDIVSDSFGPATIIVRLIKVQSDVWGVGSDSNGTVVARWSGGAWTRTPLPSVSQLSVNGLSGTASNDVWAVGVQVDARNVSIPLAQHWDGTAWTVVPTPTVDVANGSTLAGVTALATDDVWAGGYYYDSNQFAHPMIQHWDGAQWSIVDSPGYGFDRIGALGAVAGRASNDVWAIGWISNSQSLVEHWDGTRWSIMTTPNLWPNGIGLSSIAAIAANDVWIVGDYIDSNFDFQTLAEHWDGTSWTVTATANPNAGGKEHLLYDVSAMSSNDVWVVGDYDAGQSGVQTLVEHWDGTTWSVVASPNATSSGFNALYCVAATDAGIWAGGRYVGTDNFHALLVHSPS